MTGFHLWIQRHDYSSDETENVSPQQALRAWESFDWAAELAAYDESDEQRNCPPGFGLHDGYSGSKRQGALLHVCPIDPDFVFLNYHHMVEGKLLGLIPTRGESIEHVERFPLRDVPELIRLFCAGQVTDLLQRLAQASRV